MLADAATTHEESRGPIRDACTRSPGEKRGYPRRFVRVLAGSGLYLVSSYPAGHVLPRPF